MLRQVRIVADLLVGCARFGNQLIPARLQFPFRAVGLEGFGPVDRFDQQTRLAVGLPLIVLRAADNLPLEHQACDERDRQQQQGDRRHPSAYHQYDQDEQQREGYIGEHKDRRRAQHAAYQLEPAYLGCERADRGRTALEAYAQRSPEKPL